MAEKKTTAKTAPAPAVETVENPVNKMIDGLVEKAQAALKEFLTLDQEQIDHIVHEMALAGLDKHQELARMAVEETGRGVYEDKVIKNMFATEYIWHDIKKEKTVGVLDENEMEGYVEVAEPVGVIAGVTPTTNPTSTTLFKSLIAVKTRNPIIFGFHPSAQKCSAEAARIVYEAAVKAGAPENCIQWIDTPSIEATGALMNHPGVATILATGGPGMVKAAYSAGKPAIGVGAGNSPAYIERSADVKAAVDAIMASKTFDNGTICASEQSIICETCNRQQVVDELKRQGAYFMTREETEKVCRLLFKNGHAMNAKFVGRTPDVIAQAAGISIPMGTRVLIGEQDGVGEGYPLSYEKLTTVLAFYTVEDWKQACELSMQLLQNGIGHTMSLHTQNEDIVRKFAVKPASRILVNTGGSMGGTGISTGLNVAFTLGCGTCGGSSVSENVSPLNLINVKKVAYGLKNCATLLQDDKSFCHPDLGRTAAPTAECCAQRPLDFSPADIVASFERRQGCPSCGAAVQESSIDTPEQLKNASQGFTDDAHLAELVRNLIASMNH